MAHSKSFHTRSSKHSPGTPPRVTSNRKRRPSISSISSVSSLTAVEDLEDEADSEKTSEDEEGQPVRYLTSYESGKSSNCKTKAGNIGFSSSILESKKRKLSYDDGYDGQQSSMGSDYDSTDDGYGAVDEITDADDEEREVEKLEEQMIVESEDEREKLGNVPIISDDLDDANDLASLDPFEDRILFSSTSFLEDDHLYNMLNGLGETDMTSEAIETPMQRRVHFEESDSSDSDRMPTGSSDDELPDDFLQQDSLDLTLRRMIENDNGIWNTDKPCFDNIFGPSDLSTAANIYHVESDAVSDGSSGYETDEGETTDEDFPPPATITHPRSILRRDSTASLAQSGGANSHRTIPSRRRGPIMGTFIADPSKPVALVDCTGKHLVIIPAYASSRHDWLESAANSLCGTPNNSPRAATMHVVDESDTDALTCPTGPHQGPMLTSGANLMMTALGNDATPGGRVLGPPEAFFPSRTYTMDSSFEDDEDEDDEDEAMLNVNDFIDFGDGSSDEDIGKSFDDEDDNTPPLAASTVQGMDTPTPTRASETQQASSAERFLNHLDRGIVTAFRRNYNRYQALIRLPQHREFMPANSHSRPASVFRYARYADTRAPTRRRKDNHFTGGEAIRRKLLDAHRRNHLP